MIHKRIKKFLLTIKRDPDLYFHSPIDRHNIRAAWIQSDDKWLDKIFQDDPLLTPEETEDFLRAVPPGHYH